MATAAVLSSEDGLHFVIPEGTTSITQPDWRGEGRYSWEEWGVEDKGGETTVAIPTTSGIIVGLSSLLSKDAARQHSLPSLRL